MNIYLSIDLKFTGYLAAENVLMHTKFHEDRWKLFWLISLKNASRATQNLDRDFIFPLSAKATTRET